jgi:hypothetical protein
LIEFENSQTNSQGGFLAVLERSRTIWRDLALLKILPKKNLIEE